MQNDELEVLRDVFEGEIDVDCVNPISFTIRALTTAPGCVGTWTTARVDREMPCVVDLRISFPGSYPSCSGFDFVIVSSKLNAAEHNEGSRAIRDTCKLLQGMPSVHSAVLAFRDAVVAKREELALEQLVDEQDRVQVELDAAVTAAMDWTNAEGYLGRRCIYFHHILSTQKRQCIVRWAKDLRLSGFCEIGYPGILLVEGTEVACEEYVRCLQALRWKLMVVRGEERIDVNSSGKAFEQLCRVPHKGVIETEDSGEIGACCERCGLGDLFRTSLKIYKS